MTLSTGLLTLSIAEEAATSVTSVTATARPFSDRSDGSVAKLVAAPFRGRFTAEAPCEAGDVSPSFGNRTHSVRSRTVLRGIDGTVLAPMGGETRSAEGFTTMSARASDIPGTSLHFQRPRMSLSVNPSLPVMMHQGPVNERNEVRSIYFSAKRMFDTTAALILLVMFSPIMMLVALAIMLDGGGTILFRQPRIGYSCRHFMMLKFRTMRSDGFVPSVPIKSDRDPRITRVGRFLRKMSLDELPQLWNVLRGDMSLVGPRPELVEMLRFYRPEHYLRHRAMPGLTGWWQVNGRCRRRLGCSPDEDLQLKLVDDLEYLERRSFLFDLHLLVKTIPVVITGRGAA